MSRHFCKITNYNKWTYFKLTFFLYHINKIKQKLFSKYIKNDCRYFLLFSLEILNTLLHIFGQIMNLSKNQDGRQTRGITPKLILFYTQFWIGHISNLQKFIHYHGKFVQNSQLVSGNCKSKQLQHAFRIIWNAMPNCQSSELKV